MKKVTIRKCLKKSLIILILAAFTPGCTEHFLKGNLYCFTGETVGSFLEKHEDVYSDFIYILKRTGDMSLMKAYGTYTCFAPTNKAIERFLVKQDSIWNASLEPGSKREIWTGITSPRLEELSDSMCNIIAKTHIIAKTILTMDIDGSDVLREKNLNDRFLTVRYAVDENLHTQLFISEALMIASDEEVENGVVHTMGDVMNPSSKMIPTQISDTPFLTIFYEALRVTGLEAEMQEYEDMTYERKENRYPAHRYIGFTAFCESDDVFATYGINNIYDLYAKCKEWYPEATDDDFHSSNNALYKFIAYHLLNRKLLYSRAVCYDIAKFQNGSLLFDSEMMNTSKSDRNEYLETLQGTMLKVSRPLSVDIYGHELMLNFSKAHINKSDKYHCPAGNRGARVNVHVIDPVDVKNMPKKYPNYEQDALNGTILIIDEVLVYDDDVMAGFVLNEPIRYDISAVMPELTTNNIRWGDNPDLVLSGYFNYTEIPPGYSDQLKIYCEDDCNFRYLGEFLASRSFQGDAMNFSKNADLAIRIPHMPSGTYELRVGYSAYSDRGTVQFYVDDIITGLPIDMSLLATNPLVGWVKDEFTEDNGVSNDKQMKNRGYLKGPTTQLVENATKSARDCDGCLRLVLTTRFFSADDHWIRMKRVGDHGGCMIDYFELVPVGWIRDESISLEDKRK